MSERTEESEEIRNIPLKHPKGIASLLKAAAHPKRVQVLALLLAGPKKFSDIVGHTKLSRTALSNHITQLLDSKVVRRIERGNYELTADGRELLMSAVNLYKDSQAKEARDRELLRERYSRSYFALRETEQRRKEIEFRGKYQKSWISFAAAFAGAFQALSLDVDVVDVAGYTGYAFLVNVFGEETCPSGPTALNVWNKVVDSCEWFGWNLEQIKDKQSYPSAPDIVTTEDRERATSLFEQIRNAIDAHDHPVVLWGIPVPEFGIVNGYDRDTYLVSTFRERMNQVDSPIQFDALQAPGGFHAIIIGEPNGEKLVRHDKDAIAQAMKFARGEDVAQEGYTAGPEAFTAWARVLRVSSHTQRHYHGNSYVASHTMDQRAIASQFLLRIMQHHDSMPQAAHLKAAADVYGEITSRFAKIVDFYPFAGTGVMTPEKNERQAVLLEEIKKLEEQAIMHLDQALDSWIGQAR